MDTEKKRAMEADVMSEMIAIYCRGQGHTNRSPATDAAPALCPDCRRLLDYARDRIIRCPRMDVKSFCSACLHHPLMTLHHIWIDYKARKKEKKENRT